MTFKVAATGGGAPAGWRRYVVPALIGSLMLNVGFIGAVGGAAFRHHHGGSGGHAFSAPIERGLIAFMRTLPDERAKTLLGALDGARPAIRAQRKEAKDRRREALDAFATEKLDPDALKGALQRATDAEARLQSLISAAFVETAGRLSPAERQAFRAWRERMDGHDDHHKGHGQP